MGAARHCGSCSAWTMSSDGASRMSSVLGLKVSPSTPIVSPATEPPQKSMTLRRHLLLAAVVHRRRPVSTIVCAALASRAV
jgi:hypothetical protein